MVDEDVGRLDVAVDKVAHVQPMQPLADLLEAERSLLFVQGTVTRSMLVHPGRIDQLLQVLALAQLHDHINRSWYVVLVPGNYRRLDYTYLYDLLIGGVSDLR